MGLKFSLHLCSLLVLLVLSFQQHLRPINTQNTNETCSREISRKVSSIIKRELSDRLGLKVAEKVLASCPLHPARDLYGEQEKSKSRLNYNEIQVSFDGDYRIQMYC